MNLNSFHQYHPHNHIAKISQSKQSQVPQIVLNFALPLRHISIAPNQAIDERSKFGYPKPEHNISQKAIKHMILIMLMISRLVHHCEQNMHKRQHGANGNVYIEILVIQEGDSPPKRQQHQQEDQSRISAPVAHQVHNLKEIVHLAITVGIYNMAQQFEHQRKHTRPQTDLQQQLGPVVPLLLLIPSQHADHQVLQRHQRRQPPNVVPLARRVVLLALPHLQVHVQPRRPPQPLLQQGLCAVPQHEVVHSRLLQVEGPVYLGAEGGGVVEGVGEDQFAVLLDPQLLLAVPPHLALLVQLIPPQVPRHPHQLHAEARLGRQLGRGYLQRKGHPYAGLLDADPRDIVPAGTLTEVVDVVRRRHRLPLPHRHTHEHHPQPEQARTARFIEDSHS